MLVNYFPNDGLEEDTSSKRLKIVSDYELANPQRRLMDVPKKRSGFTLHTAADDRVRWWRGYTGYGLRRALRDPPPARRVT